MKTPTTLSFRIIAIHQETAAANTYILDEINQRKVTYQAGQFLTLLLTIEGKEVRRSYSISSTPGSEQSLSITVKRIQNGQVSRFIHDTFKVGDIVTTLPPAGRFTITNEIEGVLCFIAGGSGITPVYSLIKHVLNNFKNNIILINQNTNEASTIFRKELQLLNDAFSERFTLIELFSQPANHSYFPARLNNYLLEQLVKTHIGNKKVTYYLCGPPALMRMAIFTLKLMGYEDEVIRKENYTIETVPPPLLYDETPKQVAIHYDDKKYELKVQYPASILTSALNEHIQLPHSCRGGRCSSCIALCVKGNVVMSKNEVLTDEEVAKGMILTCVSYPTTNAVIVVR